MQFKSQYVNKKHRADLADDTVRRSGKQRGIVPSPTAVVTYTDRMGDSYYLHEGKTTTGKVRYFVAKTIREGVLCGVGSMPEVHSRPSQTKENPGPSVAGAIVSALSRGETLCTESSGPRTDVLKT